MLTQIITNSIIAGSIYSLIAFGFTLIYGTMRFFNMSYGVTFSAGAYLFYVIHKIIGAPFLTALFAAMGCTSLLMLLIDRILFRGLRRKNAPSWAPIMASMGIAIIMEALITTIFGSDMRNVRTEIQRSYTILDATITPHQVKILILVFVTMIALSLFLKLTRIGKAIRATSNDPHMAAVIGIDTEQVYTVVIIIGSSLACIAGALVAMETDIEPLMGQPVLLKAIVASILGGIGSIPGAVWGGFVLGFVENFGIWKISAGWKDAIALTVLLAAILVKPSLFGIEEEEN